MRCVGPTLLEKELQKFQDQYSFHPDGKNIGPEIFEVLFPTK